MRFVFTFRSSTRLLETPKRAEEEGENNYKKKKRIKEKHSIFLYVCVYVTLAQNQTIRKIAVRPVARTKE